MENNILLFRSIQSIIPNNLFIITSFDLLQARRKEQIHVNNMTTFL